MKFHKSDTALVVIDPQNDVFERKRHLLERGRPKHHRKITPLRTSNGSSKSQKNGTSACSSRRTISTPQIRRGSSAGPAEMMMLDGKEFARPRSAQPRSFSPAPARTGLSASSRTSTTAKTVVVSPPQNLGGRKATISFLQLRKRRINNVILAGMMANLCVESHLRELLEQGFRGCRSERRDGPAPRHPQLGDGYKAAVVNYGFHRKCGADNG